MARLLLLTLTLILTTINTKAQKTNPWTEYMMPAEVHQLLESYTGDFNMEITMWMAPGQEPMTVQVSAHNKMILGGRFLEITQAGAMMGMNYQAVTTLGFNNSSRHFELATLTNMGTGILMLSGEWNSTARTADLKGLLTNPVTKKPMQVRQQINFADPDKLLIENFDTAEGEAERKTVQYKITRKK